MFALLHLHCFKLSVNLYCPGFSDFSVIKDTYAVKSSKLDVYTAYF